MYTCRKLTHYEEYFFPSRSTQKYSFLDEIVLRQTDNFEPRIHLTLKHLTVFQQIDKNKYL